jgi:hypothetical protein
LLWIGIAGTEDLILTVAVLTGLDGSSVICTVDDLSILASPFSEEMQLPVKRESQSPSIGLKEIQPQDLIELLESSPTAPSTYSIYHFLISISPSGIPHK